jgi:uncharacterized damage-inducible protein DinB
MNPYASNLGGRDPVGIIAETPDRLAQLVDTLGPERLEIPPAPGKWSAREILCHLADGETVFAFRLRQALAEDHHVIQPFDQEKWAVRYAAFAARTALAVFSAVRAWNVALIRSLSPSALSKRLTHPERGEMTLQVIVETMAGHDIGHIRQIEAIASQAVRAQ